MDVDDDDDNSGDDVNDNGDDVDVPLRVVVKMAPPFESFQRLGFFLLDEFLSSPRIWSPIRFHGVE